MSAIYDDGLTPEVLERIVHKAIQERDFQGVVDALRLMAVRDPERAEVLHTMIQAGLYVAKRRHESEAS